MPFSSLPSHEKSAAFPFQNQPLTRAPFEFLISPSQRSSSLEVCRITIAASLLSGVGENRSMSAFTSICGMRVSMKNGLETTSGLLPLAYTTSSSAAYRPSAERLPASSMPSHAISSGALFLPVKVRTTSPFAFLTRTVYASIPVVTRRDGMIRSLSFTPSALGEKYSESVDTRTGVSLVSMRIRTACEEPVLPALSVVASV